MKTWTCRILSLLTVFMTLGTKPLPASQTQNLPTITTCFGKTYENCRVLKKDPDGIYISHANGMAKLLYVDMAEKDRNALGYDADKEAAYNKGRAEKRQNILDQNLAYRRELLKAQAEMMAQAQTQAQAAAGSVEPGYGYAPAPAYDAGLPLLASWGTGNPLLPYNYGAGYRQGGFHQNANCFTRSRNVSTSWQNSLNGCSPNTNLVNYISIPGRTTRQFSNVPFATPPLTGSVPALAPVSRPAQVSRPVSVSRPAPVMGRAAVGGGGARR